MAQRLQEPTMIGLWIIENKKCCLTPKKQYSIQFIKLHGREIPHKLGPKEDQRQVVLTHRISITHLIKKIRKKWTTLMKKNQQNTEHSDNGTQRLVRCVVYCQNSSGEVGQAELPQIFLRSSTPLLAQCMRCNPPFISQHSESPTTTTDLPEQQQGALETEESQCCKHRLVLDPPPSKLNVARGSGGYAVRCDLRSEEKTLCHCAAKRATTQLVWFPWPAQIKKTETLLAKIMKRVCVRWSQPGSVSHLCVCKFIDDSERVDIHILKSFHLFNLSIFMNRERYNTPLQIDFVDWILQKNCSFRWSQSSFTNT